MKVALILDQEADEDAVAGAQAYWLVASPSNRSLAKRLRETGAYDVNSAVFDGERYASLTDAVLGVLDNIDEHHPEWTEVEAVGAALNGALVAALAELGFRAASTRQGFVVERA